jgi:hypothetical protein
MGTCCCYTLYRYTPASSNRLFYPLHSCSCRNLNRVTPSGIICDFQMSLGEFLDPVVNRFTRQTLPTVNRKHFFMNILSTKSFCLRMTHNRTLLFSRIVLKHGRHFDYETSLLMCACASATWTVMKVECADT